MSYFPNQGQTTSARSQSIVPASDSPQFPTGNITTKYRNNCEALPLVSEWTTTTASGDLLALDGNSNGASYWVLSKSPFNPGTESIIDGLNLFEMPVELSLGIHRSQAALNQEFAIEFVDNGTPSAPASEVAISALSQASTTLTVTTSAPHNLVPGMSIGIYGCSDSRFNYGAIVVLSVTSSTVFTASAGPGGTITGITGSPAVLGSPMLYVRRRLGGSSDGTSLILENTSATNGSYYVRSNNGDAIATGTANGNHSVTTIGSTASNQTINAAGAYSFFPTSEYKLNFQADRVQWHDGSVDSVTGTSNRVTRSTICPDPTKNYKLRFRATNNKGLTAPVGKIVSVSKAGSATATVTFASAHGLKVDDYLVGYGVRDQGNFANITTAVKVASIVSPTVITITWGGTGTATSYGGFMSRSQGGSAQAGAATNAPSSVSVTNSIVTVIFTTTFSAASIGDYVDLYGFRDTTSGPDLGLDGTYRIQNIATSTVTLEPIGSTVPPVSLASANFGGAIIKRTDLRISFIRIFDFIRERVEFSPRPVTDGSAGMPVNIATAVSLTSALQPSATLGASSYHKLISANSTNATSVKTSNGSINALHVSNTNATAYAYLKIYNKASAPTVGTDVPVFTFAIPPAGIRTIDCGTSATRLSTGIAYALTLNPADADTTAVPANEIIVNMSYT